MSTPKPTVWDIEPHTIVKHAILKKYLDRWFPILDSAHHEVLYVDGFCGPGRYRGGEEGSPLVALNVARHHQRKLTGRINFWFIDEREDRVEHLLKELKAVVRPSNFDVNVECGRFDEVITRRLGGQGAGIATIAPKFIFVDPFGFSGVPFNLLSELMAPRSTEIFVTFMVDAMNRFLEHPDVKISQHIIEFFGTDECLDIAKSVGDRIIQLCVLYQRQLMEIAKFVRLFEMTDQHGRPIYYLLFASNHSLGYVKMKEAMWEIVPDGSYSFSDRTDPNQLVLLNLQAETGLVPLLLAKFREGRDHEVKEMREFVERETAFLKKHMNQCLKAMEKNSQVFVKPQKADGTPRRAGTFPDDAIVKFSDK